MARLALLLLLFLVVAGALAQQTCQRDSDCFKVSQKPQYAHCVSGSCACTDGFSGAATTSDKCRCIPFPGQPEVDNSEVLARGDSPLGLGLYCHNPRVAADAQRAQCKNDRIEKAPLTCGP